MDDYRVYTRNSTTGRVTLEVPMPPQKVSGLDKLIQIVLLALLNDPGRSAFYPKEGSGLPSLIGSNVSSEDSTEVIAEASEKVDKIEAEILESQSELENEDPSERLREIIILNAESGVNIDEILVKLKVISEAGDESNLVI